MGRPGRLRPGLKEAGALGEPVGSNAGSATQRAARASPRATSPSANARSAIQLLIAEGAALDYLTLGSRPMCEQHDAISDWCCQSKEDANNAYYAFIRTKTGYGPLDTQPAFQLRVAPHSPKRVPGATQDSYVSVVHKPETDIYHGGSAHY